MRHTGVGGRNTHPGLTYGGHSESRVAQRRLARYDRIGKAGGGEPFLHFGRGVKVIVTRCESIEKIDCPQPEGNDSTLAVPEKVQDADPRQQHAGAHSHTDAGPDAYSNADARRIVDLSGEFEIRESESRHYQSSQDCESNQPRRDNGENYWSVSHR